MAHDAGNQDRTLTQSREPTTPLRVLLADDDQEILGALESLLSDRYEIVARVKDGQALLRQVEQHVPDIAIVDISMPGLNGIDATRKIVQTLPGVKVIILTVHDEPAYVEAAFEAGARGYLLKFDARSELVPAITAVAADKSYISQALKL